MVYVSLHLLHILTPSPDEAGNAWLMWCEDHCGGRSDSMYTALLIESGNWSIELD